MSIMTLVRKAPRLSAILAVAAAVVTVPAILLAWGPDRPTYTIDHPADHVTFNSITDNPDYGDERNFVRIKDASDTAAGGWSDEVNVQPGKEYLVQMYVHNNAATSLNASGKGIAKNVNVKASVPTTTGKSVQVDGFISADNASPKEVWDQATFKSSAQNFNVAYVAGSATYYNNVYPKGTHLADSIVTNSGVKVGYDKMDGTVPGCFQYSGYVSFKVKPQFAKKTDFTVSKEVSKHGDNKWVENYAAKPGETVDYLVEYKNTGEVQMDNVQMNDTLPKGLSYENGSSVLGNALHSSGIKTNDSITTKGLNVGSYGPGGNAWVIFSAKVADADALECGPSTLKNVVKVETDYGTKEDSANVTVTGNECKQPKDIQVCELATKKIVTIKESDFDSSKYSKDVNDCKETPVTPETPTTPSTPAELPHTGPADVLGKLIGVLSLTSATAYYVASRRS